MSRLVRQDSYAYWAARGGGLTVNINLEGSAKMQTALRGMSRQAFFTAGRAV
jgi:hypothetical protein